MKRKVERLLIDQKALRQGLAGKVERKDRPAWHVGGTQQLTGRRASLLRRRKSDSRGMVDHDVFRAWNRYRPANDHLHVFLSSILSSSREESASERRWCSEASLGAMDLSAILGSATRIESGCAASIMRLRAVSPMWARPADRAACEHGGGC